MDVDCHMNNVAYIGEPTEAHHAASKNYVDTNINGITKFVKKDGDTMTGDLNIDVRNGTNTGLQAKLTLHGARTGNADPIGSIHFENNNSNVSGELGFYSEQTNDSTKSFFKFNHHIQMDNWDITGVKALGIQLNGAIKCDGLEMIKFKRSNNNAAGNAQVKIERAHANSRRTFAIRGNDTSNNLTDLLYALTYSSGGDSVAYTGRIDQDNHIATKKYVDDNAGGGGGGDFLPLDGSKKMQSDLDMDLNKITNVKECTSDKDAANKEYVDTHARLGRGFRINFNSDTPPVGEVYQSHNTVGTGRTFVFSKEDDEGHYYNLESSSIADNGPNKNWYGVGRNRNGNVFCMFKTKTVKRKDGQHFEAENCEILYQQAISSGALTYWTFSPFW